VLGTILAACSLVAWVVVPIGKFVRYLAAGPELSRTRGRAALSSLAVVLAAVIGIGFVSAPDRFRGEGVVQMREAPVYVGEEGFAFELLPSGAEVSPKGPPLARLRNPELEAKLAQAEARSRELQVRYRLEEANSLANAQIVAEQLAAEEETLAWLRRRSALLEIHAPIAGRWVAPKFDQVHDAYLHRGDRLGTVVAAAPLIIRANVEQAAAARLIPEEIRGVEIQIRGRADRGKPFAGRLERILPAGLERLASPALGHQASGTFLTSMEDPNGTKAAERVREIWVLPDPEAGVRLLGGQRVVVRIEMPPRPLAVQWWHSILQVFQKRFHVA